jgi:hypothetical protein
MDLGSMSINILRIMRGEGMAVEAINPGVQVSGPHVVAPAGDPMISGGVAIQAGHVVSLGRHMHIQGDGPG